MKRLLVLVMAIALAAFYVGTLTVRAENQPHMRAALEHLQAAKAELEKAEADKGGHREAALKATNEAIGHVHEGIEFANKHHH
jgi:protein involved in temperature-dependent protein secretion